jgi:HEPN domain-containing protein
LGRNNPIDRDAAEFDFNAQYRIDFGSKTDYKIVSVLDIYSYNQDDLGNVLSHDDVEVDIDVEKRNIRRALDLAKKLKSLFQRRKVLRRLFLHWFRCKNAKMAADLTAFIESEVLRRDILREEETHFFTSYWRRRGRQERTAYSCYSHWRSFGDNYRASEFVPPDEAEGKRWIKQSEADLNVAKMLQNKSHSQVCFMSQQCVEKVLKGVLYAKYGIPGRELRTHYISRLVSVVSRLEGAPTEVGRSYAVADYYLPTRYPDNQPKYRVPAEQYSEEQAKEALEVAEAVYTALEEFVDNT